MTAALRFRRERLIIIKEFLAVYKQNPCVRPFAAEQFLEPGSFFIVLDRHAEGVETMRILTAVGVMYVYIGMAIRASAQDELVPSAS